jgi:hypothetical protein
MCYDTTPISISATPSGGNFSGNGVSLNQLFFSMVLAGEGDHTITYSVSINGFTCPARARVVITVHRDIIDFSIPEYTCSNSDYILVPTKVGGNFSGNGTNDDVFSASDAGEGVHHITYEYDNNSTNCTTSVTKTTTVLVRPVLNLPSSYICGNAGPLVLNFGKPSGGIYLGQGVIFNDTTGTYYFNPQITGSTVRIISYDISGTVYAFSNCSNIATAALSIVAADDYPCSPKVNSTTTNPPPPSTTTTQSPTTYYIDTDTFDPLDNRTKNDTDGRDAKIEAIAINTLPGWAIALIVVLCVLFIAAIILAIFFFHKHRRDKLPEVIELNQVNTDGSVSSITATKDLIKSVATANKQQ